MLEPKFKLLAKFRRFKRDEDGATAVEFAILALPFCALLFSIIELAIVFFLSANLNDASATMARKIRVGQFQVTSGASGDTFRDAICAEMTSNSNCIQKLRVDVVTSPSGQFQGVTIPPPPPVDPTAPVGTLPGNVYSSSSGSEVVVVRAQYYHTLTIPSAVTRLANTSGNRRIITSITAFRNEPF